MSTRVPLYRELRHDMSNFDFLAPKWRAIHCQNAVAHGTTIDYWPQNGVQITSCRYSLYKGTLSTNKY